jgi:E1-E2 ATPase
MFAANRSWFERVGYATPDWHREPPMDLLERLDVAHDVKGATARKKKAARKQKKSGSDDEDGIRDPVVAKFLERGLASAEAARRLRDVRHVNHYMIGQDLSKVLPNMCSVVRDGAELRVPADSVVAGDVLRLRAGDRIPADCRFLRIGDLPAPALDFGASRASVKSDDNDHDGGASRGGSEAYWRRRAEVQTSTCKVDNSTVTGENEPQRRKATTGKNEGVSLFEATNVGFEGTFVDEGSGEAVVTAVGEKSLNGQLGDLRVQFDDGLGIFAGMKAKANMKKLQKRCNLFVRTRGIAHALASARTVLVIEWDWACSPEDEGWLLHARALGLRVVLVNTNFRDFSGLLRRMGELGLVDNVQERLRRHGKSHEKAAADEKSRTSASDEPCNSDSATDDSDDQAEDLGNTPIFAEIACMVERDGIHWPSFDFTRAWKAGSVAVIPNRCEPVGDLLNVLAGDNEHTCYVGDSFSIGVRFASVGVTFAYAVDQIREQADAVLLDNNSLSLFKGLALLRGVKLEEFTLPPMAKSARRR